MNKSPQSINLLILGKGKIINHEAEKKPDQSVNAAVSFLTFKSWTKKPINYRFFFLVLKKTIKVVQLCVSLRRGQAFFVPKVIKRRFEY